MSDHLGRLERKIKVEVKFQTIVLDNVDETFIKQTIINETDNSLIEFMWTEKEFFDIVNKLKRK